MKRIHTADEFAQWHRALEPEYVVSKSRGRVLVPCMNTVLVATAMVTENLYNPNSVSPDKMDLLRQSVLDNGVCFPVVAIWDGEQACFVVVDGAHRTKILGPEWLDCDYIPVVVLEHDMSKRLAATWQFNKARGVHQVDVDAELIRRLIEQGLTDEEVGEKLGVDMDTVHRYKQVTGVADLFKNVEYSLSWEMVEQEAT